MEESLESFKKNPCQKWLNKEKGTSNRLKPHFKKKLR